MINYVENEKKRLLDSLLVENFINNKYKVEIKNISLKVDKYLNMTGHSFTIYTDIKMDNDELKKYDKETSKIIINYTIYGKYNKIVGTGENTIYFNGMLTETEFKGSKTLKYEFNDYILKDINKIKMQIDAELNEKSTPMDAKKEKLLNSIETKPEIENKYDIIIENFGLRIIDSTMITFYADTTLSSEELESISFKCVLYDENNSIINVSSHNIDMNKYTGIDTLEFPFYENYENIAKVKIFPSQILTK